MGPLAIAVVGAGEAPVATEVEDAEVFVIDGELLKGLEENAEATFPDDSPPRT